MASVPIIFGWGKKGKIVGYVGIDKCPNCKNYVHFHIYEYSNRINIYYLPIAKFNNKNYLVCSVCEAAYELNDDLKEHYFTEMYASMSLQDTEDIFLKSAEIITHNFLEIFEKDIDMELKITQLIDACVEKLEIRYNNKEYIEKVARIAFQSLLDKDKAR